MAAEAKGQYVDLGRDRLQMVLTMVVMMVVVAIDDVISNM